MPDLTPTEIVGDALAGWVRSMGGDPGWLRPYGAARVVLDALTAAGRLLPEGGQTLVEWGVRNANGWGAWAPNAPRRESAEYHAERLGRQLVRREVQQFADGSSYSGPWVAVDPEEKTDA